MTALQTSDAELRQLAEAFDTFNTVSSQLEASYSSLESRMAELRKQLRAAEARRRAETQSKHLLAERMHKVLEALPGAVVVLDSNGCVSEANSVAHAWLQGLANGEPWPAVSARVFEPALSEHGDLLQKDGRRLVLTRQTLGGGRGTILLLTDVTEQRKFDELVERHQRLAALGEMVATLAHQIRTPVTSALLYASNAVRADIDQSRRIGLVEKAMACLHDIEQLINDMLLFAGGRSAIADSEFPLAELLERVERAARPQCSDGQTLMLVGAPRATLRGNCDALASAVQNLVINALQAGARRIELRGASTPETVELLIEDDGPGIASADAAHIFEPFFTRRAGGTGLGLAVARSIVRAHHGDITLLADRGRGASFVVCLPQAAAREGMERTR